MRSSSRAKRGSARPPCGASASNAPRRRATTWRSPGWANFETKLSYSALGDLFDDVPEDTVATLPPPQRKALDLALLRAETNGIQPDPRAVALGALGALRAVAAERPVLLAIDDIQWLDSPSAQVLRFVVRRLKGHPIGVLATMRLGEGLTNPVPLEGIGPEGAQRIFVGPLPADAFGKLIRERLGTEVPHTVAERVHDASGGNPFFGLEIARELSRRGALAPGASSSLPDVRPPWCERGSRTCRRTADVRCASPRRLHDPRCAWCRTRGSALRPRGRSPKPRRPASSGWTAVASPSRIR